MIFKVADIAFDIAENYRYKEDNPDLTLLKQAIQNYVSGDWGPTYWILTVMNGQYTKMNLNYSYSIAISWQNGKIRITSASKELSLVINKLTTKA